MDTMGEKGGRKEESNADEWTGRRDGLAYMVTVLLRIMR